MNIFVFEPRINLVIAALIFYAIFLAFGLTLTWVGKFIGAKIARRRRLKRLQKEVRYV